MEPQTPSAGFPRAPKLNLRPNTPAAPAPGVPMPPPGVPAGMPPMPGMMPGMPTPPPGAAPKAAGPKLAVRPAGPKPAPTLKPRPAAGGATAVKPPKVAVPKPAAAAVPKPTAAAVPKTVVRPGGVKPAVPGAPGKEGEAAAATPEAAPAESNKESTIGTVLDFLTLAASIAGAVLLYLDYTSAAILF